MKLFPVILLLTLMISIGYSSGIVQAQEVDPIVTQRDECNISGNCTLQDLTDTAANLSKWIVAVAASMALAFFVIGGGVLITSGGNQSRIEMGKNMIRGSVLGLGVILLSWVIINFIINAFSGGGGPVGQIF